jgi:hypothetical protein
VQHGDCVSASRNASTDSTHVMTDARVTQIVLKHRVATRIEVFHEDNATRCVYLIRCIGGAFHFPLNAAGFGQ